MTVFAKRLVLILSIGAAVVALVFAVMTMSRGGETASASPAVAATSASASSPGDAAFHAPATAPARVPVSAFDGTTLRRADGTPVTVPHGEYLRGEISGTEWRRAHQEAERLQREDACRRGIPMAIEVESAIRPGESMEDFQKRASDALQAAVAANDGKPTKSAC